MPHMETLSLFSERDGLELPLLVFVPDGEVRAVVQFSHGMCENKERYAPFMEFLAARGFACAISDHRGHGAEALKHGELGYFGNDGANALVDDLHQATVWLRGRFPGKRVYLFGHSMGSLAARVYAARFDGELAGLIVCGSPGWNPAAPFGRLLARFLGAFKGERKRGKFLKIITFGPFYRAFKRENSKCAWICADKAVVAAYEADPLCGFTFTYNGFEALYTLMIQCYDKRVKAGNPNLPILFISGAEDACRGGDKGFVQAVERMRGRGYARVDSRLYPGMRHEILNEAGRQAVYDDVLAWLEAREGEA